MNTKIKYIAVLLAALALPLSWASAVDTVSLQFNSNAADTVTGGGAETISVTAGTSFTLSLQIVANRTVDGLDYWLSQFSGPTVGAFSITARNYATPASSFPDPTVPDSSVTSTGDVQNNSTGVAGADGTPDNQINPRNAFNLASSAPSATNVPAGTHQVVTFTLQIAANASGTYELRTFDYSGRGWSDTINSVFDQPFSSQADIFINVSPVPEPSTWSLFGLGGVGSLGLMMLRRRRA